MRPDYFSVTHGAGGSDQDGTYETLLAVVKHAGVEAAPHLTCVGSTRAAVAAQLQRYREAGVKRIVALRGDLPATAMSAAAPGEFHYANELVSFIRKEHGDAFRIEVAAYPEMHPQAARPSEDFENFRRKVEAGADAALTQLFYNADAYFDFMERCEKAGIKIPVVPGIMPITGYANTLRFCSGCGADMPRWVRLRLEELQDDKPRSARIRIERGDAPLRDAAARRRARAALLHHQSGRPYAEVVEEPAASGEQVATLVPQLSAARARRDPSGLTLAWRQSTACRIIG